MRVESKSQLLESIHSSWNQFIELLEKIDPANVERRVRLKNSSRPESIKDVLAHLLGWHKLLLGWIQSGKNGTPELPAPGFKWNQTPNLNQQIYDQWKDVAFVSIQRRLKNSHNQIVEMTESATETDLMEPGIFTWTGKLSLAKYIASNSTSHYKWAIKKIKRIQRTPVNS